MVKQPYSGEILCFFAAIFSAVTKLDVCLVD